MTNQEIGACMIIRLDAALPEYPKFDPELRRASRRDLELSDYEKKPVLKNALRYVPEELHEALADEFMEEFLTHGRICGYRFTPKEPLHGRPINEYRGNCLQGKAFQVMIDNNLSLEIAFYPYELATYGGTGSVCQNWMQYQFLRKYLEALTDEQTLVVMSGHPLGLSHFHKQVPRVIITNGLLVGEVDNLKGWIRITVTGCSSCGQTTTGGWMYIGPQSIVHGTFNIIPNADRKCLGIPADGDLAGHLSVISGLGGMSGAQPKAVEIVGGVGIAAEVDHSRTETRHSQGWVSKVVETPEEAFRFTHESLEEEEPMSIALHGNIADLLQYAVDHNEKTELLSDQTSCHVPYDGSYCPQGISFEGRARFLVEDRKQFIKLADGTLTRYFHLIQKLVGRDSYLFDYSNSFMKVISDAGNPEIAKNKRDTTEGLIFPSYVGDIMGPMLLDYGYGPLHWCCLSGKHEDLLKTDHATMEIIDLNHRSQDRDNRVWTCDADKNKLVVGTQYRVLHQDALGRRGIALRFNEMVRNKEIRPVMLGRDHHDTGGTDSPYHETSNIYDGSQFTADMATHCFAGSAACGMSLVVLHNGGGVGTGKAINGGFGLVLDGSELTDQIIRGSIPWDTMVGVSRRNWAWNKHSIETVAAYNEKSKDSDHVTMPYIVSDSLIEQASRRATEKY